MQEIARQLLELPNVVQVADVKDWHTALNQLGITPSLQPNGADLLYARRTAEDADYYFLYNQEKYFSRDKMWLPLNDTSITLSASKPGRIPYLLNLWSGEIIPIPDYTHVTKDAVVVQLKLTGNDAMAVVLADPGWYDGPVPELAGKPIEELPRNHFPAPSLTLDSAQYMHFIPRCRKVICIPTVLPSLICSLLFPA